MADLQRRFETLALAKRVQPDGADVRVDVLVAELGFHVLALRHETEVGAGQRVVGQLFDRRTPSRRVIAARRARRARARPRSRQSEAEHGYEPSLVDRQRDALRVRPLLVDDVDPPACGDADVGVSAGSDERCGEDLRRR